MLPNFDDETRLVLEKCRIWQETYLNAGGHYIGKPLTGFPYKPGEYVPVTVRYSAMLEHQYACRVAEYDKRNVHSRGD